MKCPVFDQHKFVVTCDLKKCKYCDNINCQEKYKHNHEHDHHVHCSSCETKINEILLTDYIKEHIYEHIEKNIIDRIKNTVKREVIQELIEDRDNILKKLNTIHKYNKKVFDSYDDAYNDAVNKELYPGEEYIVYYYDSSTFNINAIIAVGNIKQTDQNIIFNNDTEYTNIYNKLDMLDSSVTGLYDITEENEYIVAKSIININSSISDLKDKLIDLYLK